MPKSLVSPHTEGLLLGMVGAGEIQRGSVGREGDGQRQRKEQKRENKGQIDRGETTKRKQSPT